MQGLVFLVAFSLVIVTDVSGGGGGGGGNGGSSKAWDDEDRTSSKLNKLFRWELQEMAIKEKFTEWCISHKHCGGFDFDNWKDWLKKDEFLYCRNHQDCLWMDPNLQCQEFDTRPDPRSAWFDWEKSDMLGECDCQHGDVWEEESLSCQREMLHGKDIAIIVVCCILAFGLIIILGLECYRRY